MDLQPDLLSVILRLHTTEGPALPYLGQALFSLLHSDHRPMEAIVVTQNFAAPQIKEVEDLLARFAWDQGCVMRTVNFSHPEKRDHRSALLNTGMSAAQGRYLAFLDYDDYVHGNAHAVLIGQLRRSQAAVAFGGCLLARVSTKHGWKTTGKTQFWQEKEAADFLQGNLFPPHSFVIDRQRLNHELPRFNENTCHMEDYEFLLELRLLTPFDLTCWKQMLVEYVMRDDGTNTLFVDAAEATPAKWKAWRIAYTALKPLRERVTRHVREEKEAGLSSPTS